MGVRHAKEILERAISRGLVAAADAQEIFRRVRAEAADGGEVDVIDLLASASGLDRRLLVILDDRQMVGRRFGNFEIEAKLGAGAMGSVFRAVQTSLGRQVALKILDPALALQETFKERFLREARAAAKLDHPNVVQPIELGEEDTFLYFAMELLEESAADRVERGPLPIDDVIEVGASIASALEYAEGLGIVHRDIKPGNILFSKHGAIKLADLGLVLEPSKGDEAAPLTAVGRAMGTPEYMAPEQGKGQRDLDVRTDMYALGITLFELLAAQRPFDGPDGIAIMLQHIGDPLPDVGALRPDTPPALVRVIERMTQKERDRRYPTAGALRDALLAVRDGAPAAPPPEPPAEAPSPAEPAPPAEEEEEAVVVLEALGPDEGAPRRRSSGGLALLAIAAVAALALAVSRWGSRAETDGPPRRDPTETPAANATAHTGTQAPATQGTRATPPAPAAPAAPAAHGEAAEALAAVRALEADHPEDYASLIVRYGEVARRHPLTPAATEATRRASALAEKRNATATERWTAARMRIEKALAAERFSEALALAMPLPSALQGSPIDAEIRETRSRVVAKAAAAWKRTRERIDGEDGLRARGKIDDALRALEPFAQATAPTMAAVRAQAQALQARLTVLLALHHDMIFVPPGPAQLGSDKGLPNERPAHTQKLRGFYLDRAEVSRAVYLQFLEASGRALGLPDPPGFVAGHPAKGEEGWPVTGVSLAEAKAFAAWVGKRLPTEAEWERAARGAEGRAFPWGESWNRGRAPRQALIRATRARRRHPLATSDSEYDNQHPDGFFHLAGNVAEWTDTVYDLYPGHPAPFTERGLGRHRVVKGGDLETTIAPIGCRGAFRVGVPELSRLSYVGFRCAKDP